MLSPTAILRRESHITVLWESLYNIILDTEPLKEGLGFSVYMSE